jgi:hypothetical protein
VREVLIGTQTNYSAIVRPLQWLVVALIFVFFLRVIRAVSVETRPGGRRKERQARSRGGSFEVLEPIEREGERFQIDVNESKSLGRSISNDIPMLTDVYASSNHAKLSRDEKGLLVEDLGSTNGTYVNAERIYGPTRVSKGDIVQIGEMILEVTR